MPVRSFEKCHRSSAAVTLNKYEPDIQQVTGISRFLKIWEIGGTEEIGLAIPTPERESVWLIRDVCHWSSVTCCRYMCIIVMSSIYTGIILCMRPANVTSSLFGWAHTKLFLYIRNVKVCILKICCCFFTIMTTGENVFLFVLQYISYYPMCLLYDGPFLANLFWITVGL